MINSRKGWDIWRRGEKLNFFYQSFIYLFISNKEHPYDFLHNLHKWYNDADRIRVLLNCLKTP